MGQGVAFEALITALACLLPSQSPINLFNHEMIFVTPETEKSFCNAFQNFNKSVNAVEFETDQSEKQLLEMDYKLAELKSKKRLVPEDLPPDCTGLEYGVYEFLAFDNKSSYYTICDHTLPHGDWMIILKKSNKKIDITELNNGFGRPYEDDFFIGEANVLALTKAQDKEAWVYATDKNNLPEYARHDEFKLETPGSKNYLKETKKSRGSAVHILHQLTTMSLEHWWNKTSKEFNTVTIYLRNQQR